MADFAYDGDVITHEFGHYMAATLARYRSKASKMRSEPMTHRVR